MTAPAPCAVCGAVEWWPLPDPGSRSVTTAGRVFDQPLAKSQCGRCGLLQRVGQAHFSATSFYETSYSFYNRPGAQQYDAARYDAMARWIGDAVGAAPTRVLDAGCGRGWMLDAMRRRFPDAVFVGVEPSEQESDNARRRGFDVRSGRIGADADSVGAFGVIYSTNVIEHTASPADFLCGLAAMLEPSGRIVITCPDASRPGSEMLFADQSFSLLPGHFDRISERAGLCVADWHPEPGDISLQDKQLIVLRRRGQAPNGRRPPAVDLRDLFDQRRTYVAAWQRLESVLRARIAGARRVRHFGASTWSFLVAAYCPGYWATVIECLIDGGGGEFFGKPVRDARHAEWADGDAVVLGVNPSSQRGFAARWRDRPIAVVCWDDVVQR